MYKHCNTEESVRRQRQLEQCLLELTADISYGTITIGQICEKAGVSRKSFYRYFDNKDDCMNALIDHVIMDGAAYYISGATDNRFDLSLCTRIFEYWQQQTPLLNALEKNGQSLLIMQRLIRYILVEEPEYARYMGIPQDQTLEHIVYTVGGIMGLIFTWHHQRYPKTAAQMGEVLYQLVQRKTS